MTAPRWDVVGVGENSVDRIVTLAARPAFGPGAKLAIQSQTRAAGGQVATALCACAALGLRTAYVGTFGSDDDGRFARRELERRGVDVSAAATAEAPNRHAIILVDPDGERLVLWARDPALAQPPASLPAAMLWQTRALHVDGVDPGASLEAARIARAAGAVVTCDLDAAGGDTAALFEAATVPILAEDVPARLTGEADVERALHALRRRHQGPICVTLGARGALLLDGHRLHHAPAPPVRAMDTTGAGDVFRGAFLAALLEGRPPAGAMRFAVAAAAVSCTRVGALAGVPTRAEIDAQLSSRAS